LSFSQLFRGILKQETGKTAQEYIQVKMIEIAKDAILDSNLNTKQISDMLCFQYPQHFLHFFKKQVGCTPKEYRTQNIGIS